MPFAAFLADATAPDAATAALGEWGALANLSCLVFVLVLAGYENLVGKPRREDKQQAHLERIATMFREETREQRAMQTALVESLRADTRSLTDRTTEAITQLASSVQSLRLDLRTHAPPKE